MNFLITILISAFCLSVTPQEALVDKAMNYMVSQPDRAIAMVDSLEARGDLDHVRKSYLEAMVTYYGKHLPDSCASMCSDMLERYDFSQNPTLETDICVLMATVSTTLDRTVDVIRYATKGAAACHGLKGYEATEADLLCRVGQAKFKTGLKDEGIQMMKSSLDAIRNDKTYSAFIARVNIRKKLAEADYETGRYEDAIRNVNDALEELSRIESRPNTITGVPDGWIENGGLTDLLTFGRCQLYGRLASCSSAAGKLDEARADLAKFEEMGGEANPMNYNTVLGAYVDLGMFDKLDIATSQLRKVFATDTVSFKYVSMLDAMARAEQKQGHLKEACRLLERSSVIKDDLYQKLNGDQLAQMLMMSEVQDAKLAQKDAEARLNTIRSSFTIIFMLIGLVCLAIIVFYAIKRRKETEEMLQDTQSDLQETNQEVSDLITDLSETQTGLSGKEAELYSRILEIMEKDKPYLDPEFNITNLSSMLESNRTYTSMAVNMMSGKPFRQWLTEYRIAEVTKLLEENPDIGIDELCNASGYINTSTLYHNFKKIHGVTIREYARRKSK